MTVSGKDPSSTCMLTILPVVMPPFSLTRETMALLFVPMDKACRLNTNPIISMEDGSGWLGILSSHSVYANEVSVLMPGEETPTFIAHPTPALLPCPPDRVLRPLHQQSQSIGVPSSLS
ncbi:hypothetical protein Gotri_026143 [Gossypium trilobum]|uniref:Uncharacterized protein n=1 Tax=Gossypium trilobum TaxID=34281 RepID=A0A7J9FSD1_9ROSI|nr:hypothetical protein [Gossypium trilobum]